LEPPQVISSLGRGKGEWEIEIERDRERERVGRFDSRLCHFFKLKSSFHYININKLGTAGIFHLLYI
jgi:hypothetical protein